MSELKTLKDISTNWLAGEKRIDAGSGKEYTIPTVSDVDDIRQAAREWINFLEIEAQKTFTDYPRGNFQVAWIKHFFNLEDD